MKHFTEDEFSSEDALVKKYVKLEKRRHLTRNRLREHPSYLVKRITIEGEHRSLLLLNESALQLLPLLNSPHQSPLTIELADIKYLLPYSYLYQRRGLRIVTHAHEYLILTKDEEHASAISTFVTERHPLLIERNRRILDVRRFQELWITGSLTNGEYLLYLNFVANRSFNDLTQYPVFPWVIQDFKSAKLNGKGLY